MMFRSLLALFASAVVLHATGLHAQSITTSCPYAVLMDAETRTILFEKGANEAVSPASTAKVMTAELVFSQIKASKLSLEDTFQISENAWRTGGAMSSGSAMFAQLNSRVRVEDLIRGLVIQSGNDAAIALAEGIAGSEGVFAGMMTRRARELGLTRSTFTNAWGKGDPSQKVTSRDMVMLADHLIRTYPDLYKYFGEKEFTWNKIRQLNRNPLLFMDIGADGLKTGNIDDSGYSLVGSAVENGQRLILAINGCKTGKERADESRKLLLWGFRSFESKTLFAAGEVIGAAKVYGGRRGDVPLVADSMIRIFVPRGSGDRLLGRIVYDGPIQAPVAEGARVARLKIFRGSVLALDLPLKASESVEIGSLPQRALDAGVEYSTGLMRKYILKR